MAILRLLSSIRITVVNISFFASFFFNTNSDAVTGFQLCSFEENHISGKRLVI